MLRRILTGETAFDRALQRLAGQRRVDVRRALAAVSGSVAESQPEALLTLVQGWLVAAARPQASPEAGDRLQSTALLLLCPLAGSRGPALLEIIHHLPDDLASEANAALADLLAELAGSGSAGAVLDLLERLTADTPPREWLIGRVLAGSWVLKHQARAEAILKQLESRTGITRHITNARRALDRRVEG
jgi:hypothetical protein